MKQNRLPDALGLRLIAASAAGVERTRHLRPFAGKPGTPAPCETLCGARVGVGRRGRRPWAIRHFHPRRWSANRVSASGGGHRSEWLACSRGGASAGASRDAAQGTHIRTADHAASHREDQRWQAATTGDEDSCFVAFMAAWIWICRERTRTKLARFCRRSIRCPGKVAIPERFKQAVRSITKAANCTGCSHCHYGRAAQRARRENPFGKQCGFGSRFASRTRGQP